MKSELVAGAGMEIYAVIGLVLFVLAFVLVVVSIFSGDRSKYRQWGRIPLDEPKGNDGGSPAEEGE